MENPGLELANFQAVQTLRQTDYFGIVQNDATFYLEAMQKSLSQNGFETAFKFLS